MQKLLALGLVVLVSACSGNGGDGKGHDGGGDGGGGTAINLTLSISGEGAVTVDGATVCTSASDPCSLSVVLGGTTSVTAVPAMGYALESWSCSGQISTNPTLDLQLASGVSCVVTFAKIDEPLTVAVTDGRGGSGGVVTGTPGALACGTNATMCAAAVPYGTTVALTAAPDPFYTFVGWEGDCMGSTPSITLVVDTQKSCTARFAHVQFPLSLAVVGGGTLVANGGGATLLSCSAASCDPVAVDTPLVVTLTATPAENYRLLSWSGDCVAGAGSPSTTVTMDAARSCTATFGLVDHGLTVTTSGNGSGTVARDPDDIAYLHGTVVTLTATPDVDSDFAGWSGDCSGALAETTVTIDAERTCDAAFTLKHRTLGVTVVGPGTVTSAPLGIDITTPSMATALFDHGTVVGLAAMPALHYEASWTGDCAGQGNVGSVTMNGDRACTVTFSLVKQTLTVAVSGSGSVGSAPTGIDTTTGTPPFAAAYSWNTVVTLTATPNVDGSTQVSFVGWEGDCAGTNPIVTVTLDADRTCTAKFTVTPYDLHVAVSPSGGGSVTGTLTSAPVIDCKPDNSGDCQELKIASDKTVTLAAAAEPGYRFTGWSNCSTATTASIDVPMTNDRTCVAQFVKQWTVTVATLAGPGTVTVDRASTVTSPDTNCSAGACATTVDNAETVTVTAVPGNADVRVEAFTCSAGNKSGNVYTVSPTADVTCSVTFRQQYTVAVVATPNGGVVSSPAGIAACTSAGGTCTALFDAASAVALTATPSANYAVTWSATGGGACDGVVSNGTGPARLMTFASLDGAKACTATFAPIVVTLNGKSGGNGSVDPPTTNVTSGGAATDLTATPAPFYQVASWSGAFTSGSGTATGCTGSAATVSVSITNATVGAVYDCTATFARKQHTLTVLLAAEGEDLAGLVGPGSVTGTLGCSATSCSQLVDEGAAVSLTAIPAIDTAKEADFDFVAWSGCQTTSASAITFAMPASDVTCAAAFHRYWARAWGTDEQGELPWWDPTSNESATGVLATGGEHLVVSFAATTSNRGTRMGIYRMPLWGDVTAGALAFYALDPMLDAGQFELLGLQRFDVDGHAAFGVFDGDLGGGLQTLPMFLRVDSSKPGDDPKPTVAAVYGLDLINAKDPIAVTVDGTTAFGASGELGYASVGTLTVGGIIQPTFTDGPPQGFGLGGASYGRALSIARDGALRWDRLFCVSDETCELACRPTMVAAAAGASDGKTLAIAGTSGIQIRGAAPIGGASFYVAFLGENGDLHHLTQVTLDAGYLAVAVNDVVWSDDQKSVVVVGAVLDSEGKKHLFASQLGAGAGDPVAWSSVFDFDKVDANDFDAYDVESDGAGAYRVAGRIGMTTPSYGDDGLYLIIDKTGDVKAASVYGSGSVEAPNNESFTHVASLPGGSVGLVGTAEAFGQSLGSAGPNIESDVWGLRVRPDGTIHMNDGSNARQEPTTMTTTPVKTTLVTQACLPADVIAADTTYDAAAAGLPLVVDDKAQHQQATQCGPTASDTVYK